VQQGTAAPTSNPPGTDHLEPTTLNLDRDWYSRRLWATFPSMHFPRHLVCLFLALGFIALSSLPISEAAEPNPGSPATGQVVADDGPGWIPWTLDQFKNVNCATNTWSMSDGVIRCTGNPVGVIRSHQPVTNIELVVEWRHLQSGGNSGIFLWATEASIKNLEAGNGRLPEGIEVQVLDHGYTEQYERDHKKKADWFTTHGDVFPTGSATMKPFPPIAPNGQRSFPRKNRSRGVGEWNHYYVRAINGEVRLWVNGEEVSGGSHCKPASGYLCLESEGAPLEFRNLKVRLLP
jgi:hypothetical protein